jgi:hypothetical protein
MTLNWENQRQRLEQLYLVDKKGLKDVMAEMETRHGFRAS